jgi:hypothetical protein
MGLKIQHRKEAWRIKSLNEDLQKRIKTHVPREEGMFPTAKDEWVQEAQAILEAIGWPTYRKVGRAAERAFQQFVLGVCYCPEFMRICWQSLTQALEKSEGVNPDFVDRLRHHILMEKSGAQILGVTVPTRTDEHAIARKPLTQPAFRSRYRTGYGVSKVPGVRSYFADLRRKKQEQGTLPLNDTT